MRLADADIRPYEGLIYATTRRYVHRIEAEFEDVQQVLRLKVALALVAYDPARARPEKPDALGRTPRDKFVFNCVANQVKDLLKKRQHGELCIEDLVIAGDSEHSDKRGFGSRDRFEEKHGLTSSHDQVYGEVEEDPLDFMLPSTLSRREKRIARMLSGDYRQSEIAAKLRIDKREMERHMRSIRVKMADWKPSAEDAGAVALDILREAA